MRKIIILVLALICRVLILKFTSKPFVNSDSLMGRTSNILNRNNTLDINCHGIDKRTVSVTWEPESIKAQLIIKNGKRRNKIGHEYGPNNFIVNLDNGLTFTVGHFKTNNWHSHNYKLDIFKNTNNYKIKFKAIGPDSELTEYCFDLNGIPNDQLCMIKFDTES